MSAVALSLGALAALPDAPFSAIVFVGICLLAVASCAAWDLVVLACLAVDAHRLKRGRRPIRIGVEYGVGEDAWFESGVGTGTRFEASPGAEPYRSGDERRPVARGNPTAAAGRVARALAARLGVVTGVAMLVATIDFGSYAGCHYSPSHSPHFACVTIREAALQWMAMNPGKPCPTVDDLKVAKVLDTGFPAQDPWGGRYDVRCSDDEVVCTSPGRDRKPGTGDDIVVPEEERDAGLSGNTLAP